MSLSGLMFAGARTWDHRHFGVHISGIPDLPSASNSASIERSTFEDAGLSMGKLGAALVYKCHFIRAQPVVFTHENARVVIFDSLFSSASFMAPRPVWLADLRGSTAPSDWSATAGERDALMTLVQARAELDLENQHRAPWADWPLDHVLVLGDFSNEHRPRLEVIATALRQMNYQPVFVDDVEDVPDHDLLQKVAFPLGACRFCVVDDSSRGGQLSEIPLARTSFRSTALLRLEGSYSSAMTKGLAAPGSRVHEFKYTLNSLPAVVQQAATTLETEVRAMGQYLDTEYPWRTGDSGQDLPMVGIGPTTRGLPYTYYPRTS